MTAYDSIGVGYAAYRRPDRRIAARVRAAIGDAGSVVNVGAGVGSYEPENVAVTAVDPSRGMLDQRPAGEVDLVRAAAEHLPFRDRSFDVALAILTVHHWRDVRAGLREMVRVARRRIVILTWDPAHDGFWLTRDYFPEILEADRAAFPSLLALEAALGTVQVQPVPVPADCSDGFLGAYWRRPAAYLNPDARRAISTFSRVRAPVPALARLRADLQDGTWLKRNAGLTGCEEMDLGYRLIVASGGGRTDLRPGPPF